MLKYRPDIDGLRAIAVGGVLVYHFNESLLTGGFVGVDIFFVISGYLITKLIVTQKYSDQGFRFSNFYLRRVRRLFPALFATLLLSFLAAAWLFSPPHLIEFAESLIAAIFSVSNVFFWSVAGYFDSSSSLKPLLHTWSLSVEEQFYLVWPALLIFLLSVERARSTAIFVLLMAAASLLLNIWFFDNQARLSEMFELTDNQAAFDVPTTVFYWLPFRVFEFAIGAILVWLGSSPFRRFFLNETMFLSGLLMVVWSMGWFHDGLNFPSKAAIVPCVGTALMIYSGPAHRLVRIVSNPAMVGIGLISYSLYLVHWPLLVFYKYQSTSPLNELELAGLVVASLAGAYLMYRYVEQPLRKPRSAELGIKSPNRRFVLGVITLVIGLCIATISVIKSGGWLWRYPADRVAQLSLTNDDYTREFWQNIERLEGGFADNDKPKVLVMGDSMAGDLINVLVAADAFQELDIAAIKVRNNCKTLFGLNATAYFHIYAGGREICEAEHQRILDQAELIGQADTIILATYWWDPNRLYLVPETVRFLKQRYDAQILVLGSKVQSSNGMWFLNNHAFDINVHELRTPLHPKSLHINRVLSDSAEDYLYFDLVDLFCNDDGCQRITKEGFIIIFDESHLSEQGANFLADKVKTTPWYQSLLRRLPSSASQP